MEIEDLKKVALSIDGNITFDHNINKLNCIQVEWKLNGEGRMEMKEIKGSDFSLKADLVFLAMGFLHPIHEGLIKQLNLDLDLRGNVKATEDEYKTSVEKIFTAGDTRRGQSLVVWAIREGRQCAHEIDKYLMGHSNLPK